MLAQLIGAFLAALVVRWNFYEAFNKFDPAKGFKSQVVFNTYPNNTNPYANISQLGALRDQIIGTAMLVLLVLAIIDTRNMAPGANMAPFIIGLAVVAIGMAIGAAAGYAINPARDLGPRLAAWISGWGGAFNDQRGDFYAWVPIIGPFIGGALGGYVYDWFIGNFLPVAEPEVGRVPEDPDTGRPVDTRPDTT
jgi:glycerol uptake facilitator protein